MNVVFGNVVCLIPGWGNEDNEQLREREILDSTPRSAQRLVIILLLMGAGGINEVVAQTLDTLYRFWSARRQPDRRMRLLHWPRLKVDIAQPGKSAIDRKPGLGPGTPNYLTPSLETGASFLARNTEGLELLEPIALAEPQVEAAVGDDVDDCGVFGDAQRMMERQQNYKGPDSYPLGPGGDSGSNREESRRIAVIQEMMLG